MGYVGNQTTTAFTSMDKQDITGNGGPNYTLSHSVANANEIEVFVNNVRQEPTVAYSASGTTLTMTGNVASSDDFYVVYQGKAVGTIVPPDGSVSTAKIADGSVTLAKAADSLYRAGTWTPTLTDDSGNPASFATHVNQYVRVGNIVHLFLNIKDINTTGMTTGNNINLGGLPFNHIADNCFSSFVHTQHITINNETAFTLRFLVSSKTARFEELRTGQSDATMKVEDLTSGNAGIGFNAFYLTDDA